MFTGLVEGTGRVVRRDARTGGACLVIAGGNGLKRGDSVAVNGCCLTVARKGRHRFEADLSKETLKATNLDDLTPGDRVNLERPMKASGRLGGHLVQGHVDGTGTVLALRFQQKGNFDLEIEIPKRLRRYFIPKGSIAVDGISLTVQRLKRNSFITVIIPETIRKTNLGDRQRGDRVNLEVDIVGKYIESFLR